MSMQQQEPTVSGTLVPVPRPTTDEDKQKQQQRLDAEREHTQQLQERLAVDENDPRVVPHLEAAAQSPFNAEEQKRREAAHVDARANAEESGAKLQAARDAFREAAERLNAVRAEHEAALATFAKLEPALAPSPAHLLSPGEPTQLMFFPRPVMLNAGAGVVHYPAGIHPVPESLTTHWWLIAQGARLFKGTIPQPAPEPEPKETKAPERVKADIDDRTG